MMQQRPMTQAERAVMSREISRAQERLENARKMAHLGGDWMLAKSLAEQVRQLGNQIVQLHGGPQKISIAELVR